MILYHALCRLFLLCLSPFAWRTSHYSGCWQYWENNITGERHVTRWSGGHSPKDYPWLNDVSETRKKWLGIL